mgnify:FL=1
MKLGIVKIKLCGKHMYDFRIVVQPGRTLRSGRRGRWFESSQSDHKIKPPLRWFFLWANRGGLKTAERKREGRRC